MLCPVCKTPLLLSERQGIEIDYCGQCRGIWLDRGELDKILERSEQEERKPTLRVVEPPRETYREDYEKEHGRYDRKHGAPHRHRKRSFLSDLLDFD